VAAAVETDMIFRAALAVDQVHLQMEAMEVTVTVL
jgi:hypothetical protein